MTLSLDSRKAVLLALAGPAMPMPEMGPGDTPDADDWLAIDAMAAQHRLRPWLHHRLRNGGIGLAVPAAMAATWREAYRDAAIGALTAQAALIRLARAFAEAGVPMVALKGSRLAFFDYVEAALRPMRDIDILVAPADMAAAVEALARAGADLPADRDGAIARALNGDKHLDPVLLPDVERYVELHHRIAEPGLPCIDTDAMLADAVVANVGGTKVAFPSNEHMLGHLVLHAAYNHRFDCGPLALVDIGTMLTRRPVDPTRFVALANAGASTGASAGAGGWLPGARLVMALVDRFMGPTGFDIGQATVPAAILAESESLLLQDFDQRQQVLLAAETAQGGLAATLFARLSRGLRDRPEEGRLRWLSSRAGRTIRQARDPRARAEAASGAALARWLHGEGQPALPQDEG